MTGSKDGITYQKQSVKHVDLQIIPWKSIIIFTKHDKGSMTSRFEKQIYFLSDCKDNISIEGTIERILNQKL